jgi:hypothetical protein
MLETAPFRLFVVESKTHEKKERNCRKRAERDKKVSCIERGRWKSILLGPEIGKMRNDETSEPSGRGAGGGKARGENNE